MRRTGILFFLTICLLTTPSLLAATYAVGNCQPNLQSFATISQAVTSVPPLSTIFVCPGNYPEQVVISQPLTLKGELSGGSAAPVVTIPASGLAQSVTDHYGTVRYYQVLVQNPGGPVNITDIGVDGAGTGSASSLTGFYYQDASGTLTQVVARNQVTGFGTGMGVLVDSFMSAQTVTIQNSVVRGFDQTGIGARTDPNAPLLSITIKNNDVNGGNGSNQSFGIVASATTGTIQSNTLSNLRQALGLISSTMTTSSNTMYGYNPQGATVLIDSGSNTVKSNKIDGGGQFGLQLLSAGKNVIQSNSIVNSSTALYGCGNQVSGDTIDYNTFTDATVGINMPGGNVFQPNSFYVVGTAVVPCIN
jgi:parallel beta-helix repeat protein